MSLKAKIEAVIYASEEPVTLAQLIGLLGEEGQAELDALASNQLSLDTGDDTESFAQNEAASVDEETADEADEPTAADNEAHELPPEPQPRDPDTTTEPSDPSASESAPEAAAEPTPDAKALAVAEKLRARKLRDYFRSLLDQLIADYATADRGFEIKEVASGFRFATKPEYHDAVRGFVKSLKPPLKLSLQALETLAVVAYKQPITAPEVSEIRGVESAGTLGSLLTRKLIATAGRKQVIGRPILYKTTKDFLLRFGLKDINELPSIEEFERMAGELNEAVQEEIQMEEHAPVPDATGDTTPEDSTAEPTTGGSPVLDELHSIPEPTHSFHETPEDLMADDSTHPEGTRHEAE